MDVTAIVEGATRLLVPPGNRDRGPGAREADVFFNPAMAYSRDVGVLVLKAAAEPRWRVLDGLAAGGARGVRYAHEAGVNIHLNDWNPKAVELIERNVELNDIDATVTRRNLGALLWEGSWNMVDVDPFGSPAPFVDAAARAVVSGGIVAVTATDTAALYGTRPGPARRRYLAEPMRCEFGHELALRILGGFLTRQAAKHDLAATPVLSDAHGHSYRVYARVRRGAQRADDALSALGFAWLCTSCAERGVAEEAPRACPACSGPVRTAGPLWAGPLHDKALGTGLRAELPDAALASTKNVEKQLAFWEEEATAPALFLDVHEAAARAKAQPPPLAVLIQRLRDTGYAAARTHMSPWGVKTDAPMGEVEEVLRQGMR